MSGARDNGVCGVGVAYDSMVAGSVVNFIYLLIFSWLALHFAASFIEEPIMMKYIFTGIRMLDQPYMTDLIEANSMGHEPNMIDIYSASWGPTDDGRTVDGPRNATMRAIVRGVNEVSMILWYSSCNHKLLCFPVQILNNLLINCLIVW